MKKTLYSFIVLATLLFTDYLSAMELPQSKITIRVNKVINKTDQKIKIYGSTPLEFDEPSTPIVLINPKSQAILDFEFVATPHYLMNVMVQAAHDPDNLLMLNLQLTDTDFYATLIPYYYDIEPLSLYRKESVASGKLPLDFAANMQIYVDLIINGPRLEDAEVDVYAMVKS